MKTAMIITDLDNTLLRTDGTISDYTALVLGRCQAAGIKVAYATARSTQASRVYIERFTPDIFIGYGGALVIQGDTVIRSFDIAPDTACRLIRSCLNTPGITGIHAINTDIALSNNADASMRHYIYTDFADEEASGRAYLKISVFADNPEAVNAIAARFPMCDLLRYSGENLYRFAHRDAVKWRAVQAAAEYIGINTDSITAFGDDVNDLEMIRGCGTGVAVSNAVASVLEAADHVCASNDEDGVARWIDTHILQADEGVNP